MPGTPTPALWPNPASSILIVAATILIVARYTAEALLERQGTVPCDTPADDTENDEDDDDFEDDDFEDNETLARRLQELAMRRRRFEFLRELLIAERLGTA